MAREARRPFITPRVTVLVTVTDLKGVRQPGGGQLESLLSTKYKSNANPQDASLVDRVKVDESVDTIGFHTLSTISYDDLDTVREVAEKSVRDMDMNIIDTAVSAEIERASL